MKQAAKTLVPMQLLQMARMQVREADYLGLQYLYKAGYDPSAAVTCRQKLEALERKSPGATSRILSPTPPPADRIAATRNNIATILPVRSQNTVTTPDSRALRQCSDAGSSEISDQSNFL
jgi:beta-barrel assembly-enhancing protease